MRIFVAGAVLMCLAACHRNTNPSKSTTSSAVEEKVETKSATTEESATVVVSAEGKVVNSPAKTKSNTKAYPVTSARSFTPAQKQNLMYRYKTVPPRVLNVPEKLQKKNAKGSYYVYKSKFWYWKQADGFFYLDENYYN